MNDPNTPAVPVLLSLIAVVGLTLPPSDVPSHLQSSRVPCDSLLAKASPLAAAQNTFRTRFNPRAHRFLWTDSVAPTLVNEPAVCRAAARAYLHDTLHATPDSVLAAGVVRAGGLYFVQAWPIIRGGEFECVVVFDRQWHWLLSLCS